MLTLHRREAAVIIEGKLDSIVAEYIETTDTLRAELRTVLASELFARSAIMQRLLTYLVDRKLSGHGRPPKAYQVATEALGRSVDFDPATDSYPRVMIGRLRSMLDRYYTDTNWAHRLRIPLGSYEIELVPRPGDGDNEFPVARPPSIVPTPTPPPQTPEARFAPLSERPPHPASAPVYPLTARLLIAALAIALLVLGAWAINRYMDDSITAVLPPLLEVTPPQAGTSGVDQTLARGIDAKLRDGLRRFEGIRLLSSTPPGTTIRQPEPDYRLDTSAIRTATGAVETTFVLNRTADQQAIWSDHVSIPQSELPSFDALDSIVAQVAGDYGVIAHDFLNREPENYAAGYPCFVQFNAVRNARSAEGDARVVRCLRATVSKFPNDPVYLNALSLALLATGRQVTDAAERKARLAEAEIFAQRAFDSGSNTAAGLFAASRLHYYSGQCDEARRYGRAAIAHNPYDADMIGMFGQFAMGCGHAAVGEALLRRSIALDSSHGSIPTVVLAFLLAERGEHDAAQALLDQLPTQAKPEPQLLLVQAIVSARGGDMARARKSWRELLKLTGQTPNTPLTKTLGQFIISDAVIARAAKTLKRLGIAGNAAA